MGNSGFKAPRLSTEFIRNQADGFRAKYWNKPLPVNAESIIEFGLKLHKEPIRPIKNLWKQTGVNAVLMTNMQVFIDNDLYTLKKHKTRMQSTYAHEIGHYVLHKEIIKSFKYTTAEEYVELFNNLDENEYKWFEFQAYEFGGRLLVPVEKLIKKIQDAKKKARGNGYNHFDWSFAIDYISHDVSKHFGVSGDLISVRIRKEKLEDIILEDGSA